MILICACITPICNVKAASDNQYSVKAGKKISLKSNLKDAVWGSTDVSVAKVTQKGVVKGVAAGSCVITATANGKSELFNVKVSKKKSSDTVKVYYDEYNRLILEDAPVVFIAGSKITYFETTFAEIDNILKDTKYTYECRHTLTDIVANEFYLYIYNGKTDIAMIRFAKPDSMQAKDATVLSVYINAGAPSDLYYLSKKFNVKKVPDFNEFKNTDLFSEHINIYYSETYNGGEYAISAETVEFYYKKGERLYRFEMKFLFDSVSHKCLHALLENNY